MRSTNFIAFSILLHIMAAAAIALSPQRISEQEGTPVEVAVGEESAAPGTPDSNKPVASTAPQAPVAAAEAPAAKAPPKPAKTTIAAAPAPVKTSPAEKTAKTAAAAEPLPENLDPENDEDIPTVPQTSEAETKAAPANEEPKKEEPPAEKTADNGGAGGPAAAPAATGAKASGQAADSGELGHGGATQAGAVQYTELKQMRGNRTPAYPFSARRERREGDAELLYRVTRDGYVTDISVAKSTGSEDLDNEAVKAISKFRFVPGQEGWARHPVQFRLKGDAAAMPSRLRTKVGDAAN